MADGERLTEQHGPGPMPGATFRRFRLVRVAGGPAQVWDSATDRCSIGSDPTNDVRLEDGTVSRFHCELTIDAGGARVRDLRSRNGTCLDGVYVVEAYLRGGSMLKLGRCVLRFELPDEVGRVPLSERTQLGGLIGSSVAMRATFALLERAAASNATVLLEGETGCGKGTAAEALHHTGDRAAGPFVVVDCAALPATLIESELFGHERGAFTGAVERRIGAFEEAAGGTIFLDEIGELPAELQPKLLRVLDSRTVRRLGSSVDRPVDVRLIVATNRDLRIEVNEKRFRSDLYFRIAVVRIHMPPLRQRPEDLPLLVDHFLKAMGADAEDWARMRAPERLRALAHHAWPGNVRELRNHLERCLVLRDATPAEPVAASGTSTRVDIDVPFLQARKLLVEAFERAYLAELMTRHGGRPGAAAAAARIDRVHLYRLLRRYGLR